MTHKKIILTGVLFFGITTSAFGQATTSSTTAQAPELCAMSNGSTIPCAFLADAEKSIKDAGKVTDRVSGKEFCQKGNEFVPCNALNSEGNPTLVYKLQSYTNTVMALLAKYIFHFLFGVAALAGLVFIKKRLIK